jgi:hypothetical protein
MEDNMAQQTFPVGPAPRVTITNAYGDLNVSVWDQQAIRVDTGSRVALQQEGDLLMISNSYDDIKLEVPADTSISVTSLSGDVTIKGIRRVELKSARGNVELENISEAVELADLSGDLDVSNTLALRVRGHNGADVALSGVALVEIETVGADLSLEDAETVIVGTVGGDFDAQNVAAALRCGTVGGDCQVQGSDNTEVTVGMVGGDLQVHGAARVQVGTVGGDCEIHDVQDAVEVGQIGGDGNITEVGGNLQVGNVGGDAAVKDVGGNIEAGNIGGDMELRTAFPAGSHTRMNVGGDASVALPDNPDLSIRAAVAGDISGLTSGASGSSHMVNLVYGEGVAQLELNVGGDLHIRGFGDPRSSTFNASWGDFGREMAELGREMSKMGQELSREMANLGEELGRELAGAFSDAGWSHGADWANEVARKVEERARRAQQRAEEQAHRAEERARRMAEQQGRHAEERASRAYVRINDREWRLDPERLERIKEQARRAAAEGVAGALEAVERAVSNLHIPVPPRPPTPPTFDQPGSVPEEKATTAEDREPSAQRPASNNPAATSNASEPNLEQERIAILRMIAEGRITPEEGDLLIEALGS